MVHIFVKKGNETLSMVFFISSLQEGYIGIDNGMNKSWFDSDGIYLNHQNFPMLAFSLWDTVTRSSWCYLN